MATHVRKLLDQISDPSTKAAHSEICFKHAKDASRKAERIAPYAVTDTEAVTLERLGITTSPFATTSHTHAADKILENDCLELIGRYLPKDPTTLIQLKRSKLHLLGRGPNQDTFANYCHEPKDVLRYGLTNPHSCPRVATEYAVLADTLHFMSTSQLITLFTRNPKLQRLFATLVLPIEALHRLPSLFPEIYRLEYYANHFAYMPGGHGGGAYVHAYSTLKWLSTGQVGTHTNNYLSTGISDYLSIEKIETKAAHHVMLIQRRRHGVEWPLSPVWVFHASEYVKLPHIFYPPEANVQKTYSRELIMRLQAYCLAVKAVSLRDIFAKLRLVIETRELQRYSTADLIRLANYLLFTTGMQTVSDYESLLTKGFVAKLGARIRMRVRTMLEGIRGQSSYAALLSVTELIPVHFTTQPVRRPAQGQQWFQEAEEEPLTDDGDEDWLPRPPLLEDLELLADLEKRAGTSRSPRSENDELSPNPKQLLNNCPDPEESTEHLFDDASLFTPEQLAPHAPAIETRTEKATGKRPLSPIQEVDEIEAALRADGYEKGQTSNSTSSVIGKTTGVTIGAIVCPEYPNGGSSESRVKRKLCPPPTQHPRTTTNAADEQGVTQETAQYGQQLPPRTVELLKLHGFTALQPQFDGEAVIEPIYHNPNTITLPKSHLPNEPLYRPLSDLAAHLRRRFYQYDVDNKRATAYMSDVKNNLTGLVLPRLNRDVLAAWLSLCETAERRVHLLVIHGAGGAGKSRALQELLRAQSTLAEETNIVVPTVNLVMDWKRKMPEMDPKRFMTFEKACEREGKEVVIFDDYGKLPAGYVDAYLAIKPTTTTVILTGDQRQSVYHTSNRDAQTAMLNDNVAHFKRFCDYYINATHRQPRRLANPIKVHAEKQTGGSVARAGLIKDNDTVLVPAHRTQTALTDLGRNALTYSGCQGLTLPNVTIVLDGDTPLCSNEVLYTAFSRASESITFVNTHSDNPEFLAKLDSTPYLKTLLTGVREDEHAGEDHKPPEPVVPEPAVKTHLPVTNPDNFLDDKIENMEDKDTREIWVEEEKTNLMQTENPIIQLFPHQQAKDEALFKLTIEQRIRKASPQDNAKAVAGSLKSGDLLFEAYADFMKVPREPQEFDRDLWLHCKQLAQRTYLSKPKANLVQGTARQDPDFPANAIALFNKSQWVKKLDKVGFPFKAGQTISAFKQTTVLLTTTMALYLRKKREAHQPENVFIMCERTPSQFNNFVTERWDFNGPSYTSDYTQYDQSQDAPFLNFELRKAAHFGVPSEVLQFYKFIKMNAKTFVGNLAVMRLSGEGPTFDANTECNIAYDALRFQLNDKVNACYAGDDLVRDQVCPERSSWAYSQHLFSLTAKPLSTTRPDFCGWRLTPHGIVKSPLQLYQSLMLAIQLGKMEDVKRSYAVDYMYAYTLGDRLYEIFDEKELEAHQLTTRILIKKGMRVPHSGEHLPTFHVTSDRLIKNPHYKEMHDAEGSRMYLTAPILREDHMA